MYYSIDLLRFLIFLKQSFYSKYLFLFIYFSNLFSCLRILYEKYEFEYGNYVPMDFFLCSEFLIKLKMSASSQISFLLFLYHPLYIYLYGECKFKYRHIFSKIRSLLLKINIFEVDRKHSSHIYVYL